MNMDYSKVFELLNQDTEKEHNKKAEKVVHDKFYNKGFRDGIAVLDKIRAEIEALPKTYPFVNHIDMYVKEDDVKKIIDKYKVESEE